MNSIYLSRQAEKFLLSCNKDLKNKIQELFEVLINNPFPVDVYDLEKIKGMKKAYRIRLNKVRILIELHLYEEEIVILKIDKRSKVYRKIWV